jgi:argininosuccinate synthase
MAGIERADAVAHTGRAAGELSQLDRLLAALASTLPVVTPARTWTIGDDELATFARRHGLGATADDASGVETNFWGRSIRQADTVPSPSFAHRTQDACPDEPATIDISFESGVPTALNNVSLPLTELVGSLGMLAAIHGVGHTRSPGLLCEAPAAVLLHVAHRDLVRAWSAPELAQFSASATAAYTSAVEGARWFTPLRVALDAYFAAAQVNLNGHVRLRLFKGEYCTLLTELVRLPATAPAPRTVHSETQH